MPRRRAETRCTRPASWALRATPSTGPGLGALELRANGGASAAESPASIDRDHAILAAYGAVGSRLDSIARCTEPLRVSHAFRPDRGNLTMIVGGWPRVVQ